MSEIYENILTELKKVEGVKLIALGSRDGFLISNQTSESLELLALMSATMLKEAEKVTKRFDKICPDRVIVDFKSGKMLAAYAGKKAMISVMADHDASIDPIIKEMERAAGKIKEIL